MTWPLLFAIPYIAAENSHFLSSYVSCAFVLKLCELCISVRHKNLKRLLVWMGQILKDLMFGAVSDLWTQKLGTGSRRECEIICFYFRSWEAIAGGAVKWKGDCWKKSSEGGNDKHLPTAARYEKMATSSPRILSCLKKTLKYWIFYNAYSD